MTEDPEKVAKAINEKATGLIAEFRELETQLDNLQSGPLSADERILAAIKAVRDELGTTKVPTWPIPGPGSSACHWCTAGGGR